MRSGFPRRVWGESSQVWAGCTEINSCPTAVIAGKLDEFHNLFYLRFLSRNTGSSVAPTIDGDTTGCPGTVEHMWPL